MQCEWPEPLLPVVLLRVHGREKRAQRLEGTLSESTHTCPSAKITSNPPEFRLELPLSSRAQTVRGMVRMSKSPGAGHGTA